MPMEEGPSHIEEVGTLSPTNGTLSRAVSEEPTLIKRPPPPGGYNGWACGSNNSGQLGTGEKKGGPWQRRLMPAAPHGSRNAILTMLAASSAHRAAARCLSRITASQNISILLISLSSPPRPPHRPRRGHSEAHPLQPALGAACLWRLPRPRCHRRRRALRMGPRRPGPARLRRHGEPLGAGRRRRGSHNLPCPALWGPLSRFRALKQFERHRASESATVPSCRRQTRSPHTAHAHLRFCPRSSSQAPCRVEALENRRVLQARELSSFPSLTHPRNACPERIDTA